MGQFDQKFENTDFRTDAEKTKDQDKINESRFEQATPKIEFKATPVIESPFESHREDEIKEQEIRNRLYEMNKDLNNPIVAIDGQAVSNNIFVEIGKTTYTPKNQEKPKKKWWQF